MSNQKEQIDIIKDVIQRAMGREELHPERGIHYVSIRNGIKTAYEGVQPIPDEMDDKLLDTLRQLVTTGVLMAADEKKHRFWLAPVKRRAKGQAAGRKGVVVPPTPLPRPEPMPALSKGREEEEEKGELTPPPSVLVPSSSTERPLGWAVEGLYPSFPAYPAGPAGDDAMFEEFILFPPSDSPSSYPQVSEERVSPERSPFVTSDRIAPSTTPIITELPADTYIPPMPTLPEGGLAEPWIGYIQRLQHMLLAERERSMRAIQLQQTRRHSSDRDGEGAIARLAEEMKSLIDRAKVGLEGIFDELTRALYQAQEALHDMDRTH